MFYFAHTMWIVVVVIKGKSQLFQWASCWPVAKTVRPIDSLGKVWKRRVVCPNETILGATCPTATRPWSRGWPSQLCLTHNWLNKSLAPFICRTTAHRKWNWQFGFTDEDIQVLSKTRHFFLTIDRLQQSWLCLLGYTGWDFWSGDKGSWRKWPREVKERAVLGKYICLLIRPSPSVQTSFLPRSKRWNPNFQQV